MIVPRFNMATLITLIEPLRVANYLAPAPLYEWEVLSFDGTQIAASNGFTMAATAPPDRNRGGELLFILASWGGGNLSEHCGAVLAAPAVAAGRAALSG